MKRDSTSNTIWTTKSRNRGMEILKLMPSGLHSLCNLPTIRPLSVAKQFANVATTTYVPKHLPNRVELPRRHPARVLGTVRVEGVIKARCFAAGRFHVV